MLVEQKNPSDVSRSEALRSNGGEKSRIRPIAFYLPQFHPVPENDEWWGKGFTEWTNVTKAKPLFKGHYQPHLPADLGFYDLRLPEVREAQAALAKEYGIHGFCYYHYWFNGRRILERPFEEVLASGKPDFPFCLCWANENWTRTWDGRNKEVLLEQKYSDEDDYEHIRYLSKAFRDSRYIRVNGKPVMIVYRVANLPDAKKTSSIWREECRRLGLGEIYLCSVETNAEGQTPPEEYGFDASIEFQPLWKNAGEPERKGFFWRLLQKLRLSERAYSRNNIYDYEELVKKMLAKKKVSHKEFPGVSPSWDNSARREKALIIKNATPGAYERWLEKVLSDFKPFSRDENFVFINAWNEWAEAAHLEPCRKWGRGYLEATRRALETAGVLPGKQEKPGRQA